MLRCKNDGVCSRRPRTQYSQYSQYSMVSTLMILIFATATAAFSLPSHPSQRMQQQQQQQLSTTTSTQLHADRMVREGAEKLLHIPVRKNDASHFLCMDLWYFEFHTTERID